MKPLDVLREIRDSTLTTGERMLLMAMVLRADNKSGVVKWTGHKLLGKDTDMHPDAVRKMVRDLVERRILPEPTKEFSSNGRRICRYQLHGLAIPAADVTSSAGDDDEGAADVRSGPPPALRMSHPVAADVRPAILPSSAFKDTASQDDSRVDVIDTARKAPELTFEELEAMTPEDYAEYNRKMKERA